MVQERVSQDDVESDVALEYCIKMIVSNQLNEQDLEEQSSSSSGEGSHSDSESEGPNQTEQSKEKQLDMKHVMKAWYSQFAEKQFLGIKHDSSLFNAEQTIQRTITNKLGQAMGVALIAKFLNLTPEATQELKKCDSYEFNIFALREKTDGHELETVLPFILSRHNLIAHNKLEFNYLMNFVRALAIGYKRITYHN